MSFLLMAHLSFREKVTGKNVVHETAPDRRLGFDWRPEPVEIDYSGQWEGRARVFQGPLEEGWIGDLSVPVRSSWGLKSYRRSRRARAIPTPAFAACAR